MIPLYRQEEVWYYECDGDRECLASVESRGRGVDRDFEMGIIAPQRGRGSRCREGEVRGHLSAPHWLSFTSFARCRLSYRGSLRVDPRDDMCCRDTSWRFRRPGFRFACL